MRGSHPIPPVGPVRSATGTGRGLRSAATATPRAKDDKHHRSLGAHAWRRGGQPVRAQADLYGRQEIVCAEHRSLPSDGAGGNRGDDAPIHQHDALQLVDAVRKLEAAVSAGYASSYAGTAVWGLADDTNRGYRQELRKFARRIRQQPGPAREPALTIRSCTSSKPPNLNHHSKSCSVGCGCWKSYAGYRQRSVPVTGLSCRRWTKIKRSSARSPPSHGPRCEGSQTCANWREVRQTGNAVQWRRSACPSDYGQLRRCPCPTTDGPSDMQGPKGGGGSTRKKQGPRRASGVNSCKCSGRAMVSRPPGPRASLPGPPYTEASQSWWAGRSPTARRCASIHGAGMGRRSCASLGHGHNRCCDGGAG